MRSWICWLFGSRATAIGTLSRHFSQLKIIDNSIQSYCINSRSCHMRDLFARNMRQQEQQATEWRRRIQRMPADESACSVANANDKLEWKHCFIVKNFYFVIFLLVGFPKGTFVKTTMQFLITVRHPFWVTFIAAFVPSLIIQQSSASVVFASGHQLPEF